MKIDLDQAMAVAEVQGRSIPWDVELKFGESWARVRPLTADDEARLIKSANLSEAEARGFLLDLLEEPKPASLTMDQVIGGFVAISVAYRSNRDKRYELLAGAIKLQLAAN